MMTSYSAPLLSFEAKSTLSHPIYNKNLFSKSFIDNVKQSFCEVSKERGERLIEVDRCSELLKFMCNVRLLEQDQTFNSLKVLKKGILNWYNELHDKDKNHVYLTILKKLYKVVALIDQRKKTYLPVIDNKQPPYPLLKHLAFYKEEDEARLFPNFFIEFLLQEFLNAQPTKDEFLHEEIVKIIAKGLIEFKSLSEFEIELKKVQIAIKKVDEKHCYTPLLNNLLFKMQDLLIIDHHLGNNLRKNPPMSPIFVSQVWNYLALCDRFKRGAAYGMLSFASAVSLSLGISEGLTVGYNMHVKEKAICDYQKEHAKQYNCDFDIYQLLRNGLGSCRRFLNQTSIFGNSPLVNCSSIDTANELVRVSSQNGQVIADKQLLPAAETAGAISLGFGLVSGMVGFFYGFSKKPAGFPFDPSINLVEEMEELPTRSLNNV